MEKLFVNTLLKNARKGAIQKCPKEKCEEGCYTEMPKGFLPIYKTNQRSRYIQNSRSYTIYTNPTEWELLTVQSLLIIIYHSKEFGRHTLPNT